MTLSKESSKGSSTSLKDSTLEKEFLVNNLDTEFTSLPLTASPIKDLSVVGSYYGNSVQMEDYSLNPGQINTQKFALLPLYNELTELDESFSAFKGLSSTLSKFSSPTLSYTTSGFAPRSYISVFNNFRSDFEDFN